MPNSLLHCKSIHLLISCLGDYLSEPPRQSFAYDLLMISRKGDLLANQPAHADTSSRLYWELEEPKLTPEDLTYATRILDYSKIYPPDPPHRAASLTFRKV